MVVMVLLYAAIGMASFLVVPPVLLGAFALCISKRNPYTGSRDWPLLTAREEMQRAAVLFDKLVADPSNRVLPESDRRVMRANQIFQEALRDIKSMGRRDLCRFKWELKVIDGEATGCSAGGKIALNSTDADMDEHELAHVLCHELGHAIARHSADISALITRRAELSEACKSNSFLSSILHNAERKADMTAAVLMARIGYDPRACIGRMSRYFQVYSFSHPHPMERAEALMSSDAFKRAMEIYKTKNGVRRPYIYLFELHEGIPDKFVEMVLRIPSGSTSGSLAV